MNQSGANSENGGRQELERHEEFLELCALSISDSLSSEESAKLDRHLSVCPDCSAALRDYRKVVGFGLSTLAPDPAPDSVPAVPAASIESTKRRLFESISTETGHLSESAPSTILSLDDAHRETTLQREATTDQGRRHRALLRYAAAFILVSGLVGAAYRIGEQRAKIRSSNTPVAAVLDNGLQREVSALTQERQTLDSQLSQREQAGALLGGELTQQQDEVTKLKNEEQDLQDALMKSGETNAQLASQRDAVVQQLKDVQANVAKMQSDLDALRQQRDGDLLRATSLETRIDELSDSLKTRDDTIAEQQQLLASDRDIRDLMGARDLYIVEIYDIARNGEMKKPFGRVFLTKNKSLIFYAYDLQQQPGVNTASTFQAWGSHGPDRKAAVSLGIFYMDNAANKRWVVKVDDPKTLQQIDAVFVTVEPNGGSMKPSGKQLLFAYLRVDPNHP
jgi:hypothetical protein